MSQPNTKSEGDPLGDSRGPAKRVDSNDRSKDEDVAKSLWDLSAELTGVEPLA